MKNLKKYLSLLAVLFSSSLILSGCETFDGFFESGDDSSAKNVKYTSAPMSFLKFRDVPMADGTIMDLAKSSIYGDPYNWTGDLSLIAPYTFDGMYDFYNTEMKRFAWMPIGVVKGKYTIMTFLRRNRLLTIQIARDDDKGSQITLTMVTAQKNMEDYYEQYRITELKRGIWVLHRSDIRMMEARGMKVTNAMRALANKNAKLKGFSTIEDNEQRKEQIKIMHGFDPMKSDNKNENTSKQLQKVLNKITEDSKKRAGVDNNSPS